MTRRQVLQATVCATLARNAPAVRQRHPLRGSIVREEVCCQHSRLVPVAHEDVVTLIPSGHPVTRSIDQVPTVCATCHAVRSGDAPHEESSVVVHGDCSRIAAVDGGISGPAAIRLDDSRWWRRLTCTEHQAQHYGKRQVLSEAFHAITIAPSALSAMRVTRVGFTARRGPPAGSRGDSTLRPEHLPSCRLR